MKKIKKSLAIFLAVLMMASFTPLFASAAIPALNKASCELIEAPKLSYNGGEPTSDLTVPYGTTWGDITVVGGSIKYNGEVMDGKFDWWESSKTTVLRTGVQSSVMMYFYPTDTTKYKEGGWSSAEGWPNLTVDGTDAFAEEIPTTNGGGFGSRLSKVPLIGGKVVDENGTEITTGKWAWVTASTKLEAEGTFEYEAKWTCTGYDPIFVKIPVNVQQYKTVLAQAPTAAKLASGRMLRYATLSGGIVKLEDGTDVTSVGTWKYVNQNTIPTESGEFEVQWTAVGYSTITVKVYVEVGKLTATVDTLPTASTVAAGKQLKNIYLSGGKVVDANGTAVTTGRWAWVDDTEEYLYKSGTRKAQWTATGYVPITADVPFTLTNEPAYDIISLPTIDTIDYKPGLTYADLVVNPGEISVPGTYRIYTIANNPLEGYPQDAGTWTKGVVFTPDDATLAPVTLYITHTVNKIDFAFADSFEKLYVTVGSSINSVTARGYAYSDITTNPPGVLDRIQWDLAEFDPSDKPVGYKQNVTVQLIPSNTKSYNTQTVTIPIEIQPVTIVTFARRLSMMWMNQNAGELSIQMICDYTSLKGDITIKMNDEVVAVVKPGEDGTYNYTGSWSKQVDGEYYLTATYTPSEEDTAVVMNPVQYYNNGKPIIVDVRMSVKTFVYQPDGRSDKATALEDGIGYIKMQAPDYKSEEVEYWEVKDKNGNPVTLYDEEGNPVDYNQATFRYVVPGIEELHFYPHGPWDEEIIVNPDDGIGGILWAFWQRFVNFIVEIYSTIMDFFVPAVEQY